MEDVVTKDYEKGILRLIALEKSLDIINKYDASVLRAMVRLLNYNPHAETEVDWKILAFQNLDKIDQDALLINGMLTKNSEFTLEFYQLWDAIECIMGLDLYSPNKKAPLNFAKKLIKYKKILSLDKIDALKELGYSYNESQSSFMEVYSSFKDRVNKKGRYWIY